MSLASQSREDLLQRLRSLFVPMMRTLHENGGTRFSVQVLADPAVQEFIGAHADVLDSGFERTSMSDAMRRRLQRSDYIFSGMKTFHELNEAFPSLLDDNGNRKPFEQFLNEVRSIDQTYNEHYLRAEYNFIQSSAEMASKWERFMEDGDRYNLQYRTAKDDKVRPEHAALEGVTLPPSDPFWEEYYPPNGWNCRCTVVQVRKSKYPATSHDEAMALGAEALQKDTKGIFHFNPGLEQKTMPDYNPYTIRRCRDCDIAKGNAKLAVTIPTNQLCEACKVVRAMCDTYNQVDGSNGRVRISQHHGKTEKKENIDIAIYLANKHGWYIDLLPKENRKTDADSFNRTLGVKQEYKVNVAASISSIDNLLRKANKQASFIVLRIDSEISMSDLASAIKDRVRRSGNILNLMLIKDSSDVTFNRNQMVSESFVIKKEDFN